MPHHLRGLRFSEAAPRMLADFVLVHLSMIAALCLAVAYHVSAGADPATVAAAATQYYTLFFMALSPCFPLAFLAAGFYGTVRGFRLKQKSVIVLRGAAVSLLVFLAVNFLLFHKQLIARPVALAFSVLLIASLVAARFVKASLEELVTPGAALRPGQQVLVVGGAGYIGSVLVRQLLDAGWRVRVLDNLTYGAAAIHDLFSRPGFEFQTGDCRNIQDVVAAVKGVNAIVHLAAIVGDPACEQDRKSALEINYAATRMLVEIAKGNGVERFVFASSCSVYGATDYISGEESPAHPISLYGQTKVDSEKALLDAASANFHPTALRLSTVFGHSWRPRFDLVVNLLSAKAKQEGVITIFNGEQWRPFIHVTDVARAFVEVLQAPASVVGGEIFNVGDTRNNHTLTEIAAKVRVAFPDTKVIHQENADRRNYRVCFDKIRNRVGFQCRVTVDDGIRELKAALESGAVGSYQDPYYNNCSYLRESGTPAYRSDVDGGVMAAFAHPPAPQRAAEHSKPALVAQAS